MIEEYVRPANDREERILEAAIAECSTDLKWLPWRALLVSLFACVMAFGLSIWGGPYLSVIVGVIMGGSVTLLTYRSEKGTVLARLHRFEGALAQGQTRVLRVQPSEVVTVERDHIRSIYAFQADENLIVMAFLPSDECGNFPNTDFDLSGVLSANGGEAVVDWLVHTRGQLLEPTRNLPTKIASRLRRVRHMEVIEGKLDDLERLLGEVKQPE